MRNSAKLMMCSAAVTMTAGGIPAQAQDTTTTTAADQDAIIVLGGRLEESVPEELARYGSRLEIVQGETIDRGGYADVSSALRYLVPGLYLTPRSGDFDYVQVSLAGSRTSEVLFLVDGVRINNRLFAGTSPLDTLSADMIERIEVLKGGQGLYYGTQAVGGIVNVVTKAFTREFDGALQLGLDTNEAYRLNGYLRGGTGDHYFVAFGSHNRSDGFVSFRDADVQPSALDRRRGYRMTSIGGKYAFEPSREFRLSASWQHIEGRAETPRAEDLFRAWNERNEEIASLKIDWMPTDNLAVYVKGYYHDWDSTYLDLRPRVNPDGSLGPIFTVNDGEKWGFEDYGVNLLGEYRLSEQLGLVAGYDFQTYSGFDDVFLIAPSSEEVHAPFAQVKFDAGPVSLAAGVRHNMPSDGESKTVWNVSGRVGASESAGRFAGGGIYGRAQVGTAFRLPSASELYTIDPCCETGNPNLVGEGSFNVEGGLGFLGPRINAELLGFWREVEDLISITYALPEYPNGFYVNTDGKVEAYGGGAVIGVQLSDVFSAQVDYMHTVAKSRGSDVQLVNIPRDQAKFSVNASAPSGRFGGGAALNWVGDVFANVAAVGRVNYGDYAVLDLSAWAYVDEDLRHRFGLRLENAFDADYDTNVIRVRTDVTDISYPAGYRGKPMTLHASYRLSL